MTGRDLIGLGISYAYAFSLIGFAELIRRLRHYPLDFTRKVVHIGAGMWVFGVLAAFDNWYVGVFVFASFIVLNYLAYRSRALEAIDDDESTPGTVYFALSITILFAAFWRTNSPDNLGHIAAAGAMAMTWGDAMASLIGRRWGRHRYTFRGDTRSLEGSAAMFVASSLAMFLTLLLVPGSSLAPQAAPLSVPVCLAAAGASAIVATGAEAISPAGKDNISVPLIAGVVLYLVLMVVG